MSIRKLMGLRAIRPASHPLRQALSDRGLPSRDSLAAGAAGAILFHLLGLAAIPSSLFSVEPAEASEPYEEFLIEVAPEEPEEPETYTQTNPKVPDNEPDEAERFSARNQQAANPEPPEELDPDNRPATESEDAIETDQSITGDPSLPQQPTAPPQPEQQPTLEAQASAAAPLRREIPFLGSEPLEEPEEEGLAEDEFEEREEATVDATEFLAGEAEEGEDQDRPERERQAESPSPLRKELEATPRPRPQLPRMASVPVRNSPRGVSRVGQIATDAKFSEFGEYMERLIEAVSIRWNNESARVAAGESLTMVQLRFSLTKDGRIEDLHVVDATAGVLGISLARSAIQGGAPYGTWTREMVQTLGDEEEITFTFHYR